MPNHLQAHLPDVGISNVRYRGDGPEPHAYLRRLLSLDYVIDHPELEWFPTEAEKLTSARITASRSTACRCVFTVEQPVKSSGIFP